MPTGRICCASRSSGPSANRRLSERLFPPFVPAPAGTQERHSLNERLGPHFRGGERREGTQPTQLAGRTDRIENKTASRLPGRRPWFDALLLCSGGVVVLRRRRSDCRTSAGWPSASRCAA